MRPRIHTPVTNGGLQPDGIFVRLPAHSTEVITKARQTVALRLYIQH